MEVLFFATELDLDEDVDAAGSQANITYGCRPKAEQYPFILFYQAVILDRRLDSQ